MKPHLFCLCAALSFLTSCQAADTNLLMQSPQATATSASTQVISPSATPLPLMTAFPEQPIIKFGPEQQDFPSTFNPLTARQVQFPESLNIPAALISISNSPMTARPQAGIAFADQVIELFIGEGTTRFLAVFYGDMPRRIPVLSKIVTTEQGLKTRTSTKYQVTGRVWLDENQNDIDDPWEFGLGGVVVSVTKKDGQALQEKPISDSNGYFGLSQLTADEQYTIQFDVTQSPARQSYRYTFQYSGVPDQKIGFPIQKTVGQLPIAESDISPGKTYVGPIRSGRLTYDDFNRLFPQSCLVFASAGEGILDRLHPCLVNYGVENASSPNTSLLEVSRMVELSKAKKAANIPVNYSGNFFSTVVPAGGSPAIILDDVFHQFAQSRWVFDPLSKMYYRFTDSIDGTGVYHADTDRLTGRQIGFENVIVLFSNYSVFRHGQYDVDLCCGFEGYGVLFRDGQMFKIRWNTNNREWEQKTGLLRPIKFVGEDKKPIALHPGRTWIALMTMNSSVYELTPGHWKAEFAMPDDIAPPE